MEFGNRVELSKSLMSELLRNPAISIVHLAVHGDTQGLILRWSKEPAIRDRVPIELLTPSDIRLMFGWNPKLVVSGACRSAELAPDFLKVGASAVVAPATEVPWSRIGLFFRSCYRSYRQSAVPESALAQALLEYPEHRSYSVFRSKDEGASFPSGAG